MRGLSFTKDGSLLAYSISEGGSDWRKVIIIETNTKEIIEDTLMKSPSQKAEKINNIKSLNKNLMLHSYEIKFMIKEKKYTFRASLPDYFNKMLKTKRLTFEY